MDKRKEGRKMPFVHLSCFVVLLVLHCTALLSPLQFSRAPKQT